MDHNAHSRKTERKKRKKKPLRGPPPLMFFVKPFQLSFVTKVNEAYCCCIVEFAAGNPSPSDSSLVSCFVLRSFISPVLPPLSLLCDDHGRLILLLFFFFSFFFSVFASRRLENVVSYSAKGPLPLFWLLNMCSFSLYLSWTLYFPLYLSIPISLSPSLPRSGNHVLFFWDLIYSNAIELCV